MTSSYGSGDASVHIKVTVSEGKQVRCKVTSGKTYCFEQCVNCGDLTQTSLSLECVHRLCEECYAWGTAYSCTIDHVLTKKEQAQRNSLSHLESSENVCLECPKCLQIFGNCQKTAEHIRKMHPELSEENTDRRSVGILDEPRHKHLHNESSKEEHGTVFTSDGQAATAVGSVVSASGAPNDQTVHDIAVCRYCNSPDFREDVKKHEVTCTYRNSESNSFGGITSAGCQHPGDPNALLREVTGPTAFASVLRGEQGERNCEWSERIAGDIRELQEKAKELEKKLDRIKEPLELLTKRLERGV